MTGFLRLSGVGFVGAWFEGGRCECLLDHVGFRILRQGLGKSTGWIRHRRVLWVVGWMGHVGVGFWVVGWLWLGG